MIVSESKPQIVDVQKYRDSRGYFFELYKQSSYGLDPVQTNISQSKKGVIRGLHYQKKYPQGKLVAVLKGEIFDVAVDIREGSNNFGKYESAIISEENSKQFWVPPGFAHGFQVLSNEALVAYICTGNEYNKEDECTIIYNDEKISIEWPIEKPIISEKDLNAEGL